MRSTNSLLKTRFNFVHHCRYGGCSHKSSNQIHSRCDYRCVHCLSDIFYKVKWMEDDLYGDLFAAPAETDKTQQCAVSNSSGSIRVQLPPSCMAEAFHDHDLAEVGDLLFNFYPFIGSLINQCLMICFDSQLRTELGHCKRLLEECKVQLGETQLKV